MSLTAVFHFSVNQLWINADLRGNTLPVQIDDDTVCTIHLPSSPYDFDLSHSPTPEMAIKTYAGQTDSPMAVGVFILRVTVRGPGDILAADFDRTNEERRNSAISVAFKAIGEFHELAVSVLGKFLTWARAANGQWWTGLNGDPCQLVWRSQLLDEAGNVLPIGYPGPHASLIRDAAKIALSGETASRIIGEIMKGADPPLERIFLSDAQFLAFRSEWRNLRHALLMAAIACEIAVKRYMRNVASPDQQPLVELALANPRDVSMAAASLFDKGCKAVSGKSLREENKDLYKRLERLFRDRNQVAHSGGAELADDALIAHVRTAREAIEWLANQAR